MKAGKLNRRVTILHKVEVQNADSGNYEITWETLATVSAEVQDMLPSRAERIAEGISVARRPARIRMHYRDDVTMDMRVQYGSRMMQIVAGPSELGFREGIEIMAEEVSTQGNAV